MTLHLENHDIQNTPIEQSETKYISNTVISYFTDYSYYYASLTEHFITVSGCLCWLVPVRVSHDHLIVVS